MIFDIQKFCIHDGPGIRTTVFFKGCPLACAWCHNPESQSPRRELFYTPHLCIGCMRCAGACPAGAHSMRDDKHCFDREKCRLCFACADRCFSRALEPAGKDMTVAEVLAEVEKDRVFYEESGGGMTLSGGEPTMQFDLARDLLQGAREMGISTCVETCGLTSKDCLLALIPLVDLFLWDIKDTDPGRHLANTDAPLAPILENLREVDEHGGRTLLRCILIPDVNLNELHLDKLADIYLGLRNCEGIELLAYHRMGASKLERLGLQAGHMYEEPDNEQMDWARDYLRSKWGVHAL